MSKIRNPTSALKVGSSHIQFDTKDGYRRVVPIATIECQQDLDSLDCCQVNGHHVTQMTVIGIHRLLREP